MLKLNPADRYPPEAGRYIEATTIPGDSLRHSGYFCLGNSPEPNGLAMVGVVPWGCACRNVTNRERRAKAEDRRALAQTFRTSYNNMERAETTNCSGPLRHQLKPDFCTNPE